MHKYFLLYKCFEGSVDASANQLNNGSQLRMFSKECDCVKALAFCNHGNNMLLP
jgi:hypothetical protein